MDQRRRRDSQAWREVLDRYASSGLRVGAFCERESISEGSFYRWRSILQGVDGKKKPRGAARVPVAPTISAAPFIELGSLNSGSSRVELRLELGGGVFLTVVRG
jgi:hypothetical protein